MVRDALISNTHRQASKKANSNERDIDMATSIADVHRTRW